MSALIDDPKTEDLFNTILALKNLKEAKAFFRDLLTEAELDEFGNRWLAAKMLNSGVSYNHISGRQRAFPPPPLLAFPNGSSAARADIN